ncbi:MAG: aminotransferase class I/II-fold pyridoxal phosphate-dependent enzyme [Parvibaculum sp.]|uniref:serine palmitoyltransferase n=1 Tax=Parvibaculum sp. TaxID=2024848 RepID=UPI002ABBC069|nr:aminotransferase class I/II-fold pyridoxal phosphate-dependent enzyme [Parvibaculum sp.]MDZ4380586.1 aminotransferase class I/II-fold pyridoxal phosphate-dependent enzyme [Parvibaculum sp.]
MMSLFAKFDDVRMALEGFKTLGRDPSNIRFEQILSPTEAIADGHSVLLFGTNNYLGLTFDPACIEASAAALRSLGTGTTGSRVANGTYADHAALERQIAAFYGKSNAMVFTTGYQANLGLISTLAGRDDYLLIDADSHASIYDACKLGTAEVIRFRHNDAEDLARRLRRLDGRPGNRIVVTEGIYSMLGDTAPLREIAAVKRELGAFLIVDEAHSLGVLGERGRGLCEAADVEADVDFVVGTFSKSLGAIGGFAVSDLPGFDVLRVACRPYMFTASLPPAVIASVMAALSRLDADRSLSARVRSNGRRLYDGLVKAGFEVGPEANPIVAIKMPDPATAGLFWNRLVDEGIYLNLAVPPTTPMSLSLLRSSVSAAHTEAQIDHAISVITAIGREFGIPGGNKTRVSEPA